MARVYKPKHPSYSRTWSQPCPVCGRLVRVNTDGTVAQHFPPTPGIYYCPASREPFVSEREQFEEMIHAAEWPDRIVPALADTEARP